MVKKAFKTELQTTPDQVRFFQDCCEARRLTYNWALLRYQDAYEYVSGIAESALGRFDTDPSAMDVLLKYTFVGCDKPPSKRARAETNTKGPRTKAELAGDRAWAARQDEDPVAIAARKVAILELVEAWRPYLLELKAWEALEDDQKRSTRKPKKPKFQVRLFQLPNGDDPYNFLKICWRLVYHADWGLQWLAWENYIPSTVIDGAFTDLMAAYTNWKRYVCLPPDEKMSRPKVGYPKLKPKHANASFSVIRSNGKKARAGSNGLLITHDSITLPNIGVIGLKEKGYLPEGRNKSKITVTTAGGRWFVSVLGEFEPEQLADGRPKAGIDVGIVHYAIIKPDNGPIERVENPQHLLHGQKRLAMLQRFMSRKMGPMVRAVTMPDGSVRSFPENHIEVRRARAAGRKTVRVFQKPSHRWEKARAKVNVCHYRIACRRENFQHELTTKVVRSFSEISVETLGIQDMVRRHGKKHTNRLLRFKIGDASWYELRRQLTYKGLWYGTNVEAVSRWYPSTQECSVCRTTTEVNWHDRKCRCPKCGLVIDMDDNAAVNLLAEMIRKTAG
jgi:putative transposase